MTITATYHYQDIPCKDCNIIFKRVSRSRLCNQCKLKRRKDNTKKHNRTYYLKRKKLQKTPNKNAQ